MNTTLRNILTGAALLMLPGVTIAQRYLAEVFPNVTVTTNVQYGENISVFPPPTPASIPLMCDVYEPAGDGLDDRGAQRRRPTTIGRAGHPGRQVLCRTGVRLAATWRGDEGAKACRTSEGRLWLLL